LCLIAQAIVLQNSFPKKNKVTILHEQFGKISFFVHEKHPASRLCNGSLMYCEVEKKGSVYTCNFIDAFFIPFSHSTLHAKFMYDILKICLNFMPDETIMDDVFSLVMYVYEQSHNLDFFQKKIILLRIFLYVGVFPEDKLLYQIVMQEGLQYSDRYDLVLQQGLTHCWQSQDK